ncbi:MarR family winged helix-turn-helix transcriptional regulator [Sphingomonas faeni]|uniref:MarR family winged helix-turn-helix transcriptional regulator n=1 Tax=Sphingomonas faeni TaxID=185950 RepID=UPI0027864405|nr:MarR family winged helix-turn-helix transcriptional regulator [Sphingomonas faeni]MDQ0838858.1 DNA-binding MarR family transcriptional regulator [Sphingomonas faeni]
MTRPDGPLDAANYDTGIDVVLIAAPGAPDRLTVTLTALNGRIVACLDWRGTFGDHAAPQVIVVEAAGVDPTLLAERLPGIVDRAAALQAGLVVALGVDEIDVVAAATLGGSTRLLVDPTVGDCVAAIVVAAEAARIPAGVFDVHRETDGRRLERLNTEVARIAEALARLTRAEIEGDAPAAPIVGDRTNRYGAPPALAEPSAADVRRAIRARRLRDQFFGATLFEDPGWDMLLDLYAAELERGRVSVSSLCIAAAVAPTTALRWIARMTDTGLFERRPDMHDRRRAFMVLSDRASEAMRGYIVATKRADLRIP